MIVHDIKMHPIRTLIQDLLYLLPQAGKIGRKDRRRNHKRLHGMDSHQMGTDMLLAGRLRRDLSL